MDDFGNALQECQQRLDEAEATIRALVAGHDARPPDIGGGRESTGKFAAALLHAPTGIAVLNVSGGVVLISNEGRRIFALEPDDVRPLVDQILARQPRRPDSARLFSRPELPPQVALRGASSRGTELLVRRPGDAEDVWVHFSAAPRFDKEGRVTGAVCVFTDVTHERLLVRELSASETRLRSMHAAMACGVFIVDAARVILEVNAAALEMFSARAGELRGRRLRDVVTLRREDGAELGEDDGPVALALRTRHPQRQHTLSFLRGDRKCWIQADAVPMLGRDGDVESVVVSVIDVTARKLAEETSARAAARIQALYDAMACGVLVFAGDGAIQDANVAAAEILSCPIDGMRGRRIGDLFAFTVRSDVALADDHGSSEQAFELRPPQRGVVLGFSRPDGERRWIQVDVVLMSGPEGDAAQSVMSFIDVTERKKMHAQLLQAGQMSAIGMLAAGVAHEINNPLTYVLANVDTLVTELPNLLHAASHEKATSPLPQASDRRSDPVFADRVRFVLELLDEVDEGATRIRNVVHDLKTFSRADDQTDIIDLHTVLNVACNMAKNETRHRARLVKDYGDVPPVMANESRLGQLFVNLLINAAQAIPEGAVSENEIKLVTSTSANGEAVIEVSDTGVGISPDVARRIFDPFFTTKPVGVGTGLGLSICQGIVTAIGGTIDVTSEVGRGTTFRVTIPSTEASHPSAEMKSSLPAPAAIRTRVLVVDDEPSVARALQRILAREHDVTIATSAKEALAHLAAGESYDLVFSDLVMPDLTGANLFDSITRDYPALARHVIFMTGGAFTPGTKTLLDRVSNPCVKKPFDPHEVRALARTVVNLSRRPEAPV